MSSTTTAVKVSVTKADGEMTGTVGKDVDQEETPRLSPAPDEKPVLKKPERQYSREELIELMTHHLSSIKHPCLENPQNKSLVSGRTGVRWLEERWDSRKHTDSLEEECSDSSLDPQKKRVNDPKAERLRKEQEVVLSPQRRSFNSGCFVNLPPQHANSANRRPDSPPLKGGERDANNRDIPVRRIGSGRIMRDAMWDFRGGEKDEISGQSINNHDFNFRQRDERYERRSYERSHDKDRPQQRNQRYNNNDRRKYDRGEPEEPEWFSGGPTSQHDTIELHGFDGPVEDKAPPNKKQNKNSKNSNAKNNKKTAESVNKTEGGKKSSSRKSSPDVTEQTRLSPTPKEKQSADETKTSNPAERSAVKTSESKNSGEPDCMFNIEDILNFDSLPPILSMANGCVDEGGSGSRFSQFFRRESPSPQKQQHQDSRLSSTNDEMFNSMINDIVSTGTNISIPSERDTYFAPISPAASSVKEEGGKGSSANLLEMLHRGNNQGFPGRKITKKPSLRDLEVSGKIHSVEELEARLRQDQGVGKPNEFSNRTGNKEEELAAFRKLMMNKQIQNMQDQKSMSHTSISGGFQQGQQQQQQHPLGQQQQGQNQQQMPIPHDLVMKLLHVQQQQRQQEVFAKLLVPPRAQFSMPPPLPPLSPELQMHINNSQPTKDLMQRPEAQNILRGLKRGEVTINQLVEQLKRGTNMQPVQREVMACIVKLHSIHSGMSQREPSPANLGPPSGSEQLLHQMLHGQQSQHQQQQLRIPSPHPNVMQRVPSPRELVAHTQNILQNALLKKKLEEQKENFRKRQELQRSHSPNPAGNPGCLSPGNQQPSTTSPTPLAFTPTSVLRKMTAEKDGELSGKQHHTSDSLQQQQPPKQESVIHVNGPHSSEMMRPKPFRQLPIPNTWSLLKPIQGRAIVKGNNNFSVPPPNVPVIPSNIDFMQLPPQFNKMQPPQRNKTPQPGGNPSMFMMGVNRNNLQQPPNRGMRNMIPQSQQQQGMAQTVQQLLMSHNYNNPQQRNNNLLKADCQPGVRGHNQMQMGRNYNMSYPEGSPASPVSNQLARWFSPELLAQARAGKLPHMPPLSPTQNMLSVEELERLQQAVHN